MDERILIAVGVVLIVLGMIGAIYSGPIDLEAQSAYVAGDLEQGRALKFKADTYHFGGGGMAALGVVLMTAGLIRNKLEQTRLT